MTTRASAPRRARPPRAMPPYEATVSARPRPPREPRGLMAAALIASVLLHFIALLVFRFETPSLSTWAPPPVARIDDGVMRAYDIRPVEGGDITVAAPEPIVPDRLTPPVRFPDRVVPEPPAIETAPHAAKPAARPSAADRLSGRAVDPRLYAPPRDVGVAPDAIVRGRLADRLGAWNDSIASAADAAARARDWTVTDGDGNRWGISPEGIHLGALTIPLGYASNGDLPDLFQPPPDRRDEVNARLREWHEIQQQAARAEVRATFNERVKAIRERKEAERAKAAGEKKSGGN